jgi:hypothetical protein
MNGKKIIILSIAGVLAYAAFIAGILAIGAEIAPV